MLLTKGGCYHVVKILSSVTDEPRGLGPQQITKSVGHGLLEEGESSLGRHVWVKQDVHKRFACFYFCHGVPRDCLVINTDDGTQVGH